MVVVLIEIVVVLIGMGFRLIDMVRFRLTDMVRFRLIELVMGLAQMIIVLSGMVMGLTQMIIVLSGMVIVLITHFYDYIFIFIYNIGMENIEIE